MGGEDRGVSANFKVERTTWRNRYDPHNRNNRQSLPRPPRILPKTMELVCGRCWLTAIEAFAKRPASSVQTESLPYIIEDIMVRPRHPEVKDSRRGQDPLHQGECCQVRQMAERLDQLPELAELLRILADRVPKRSGLDLLCLEGARPVRHQDLSHWGQRRARLSSEHPDSRDWPSPRPPSASFATSQSALPAPGMFCSAYRPAPSSHRRCGRTLGLSSRQW